MHIHLKRKNLTEKRCDQPSIKLLSIKIRDFKG